MPLRLHVIAPALTAAAILTPPFTAPAAAQPTPSLSPAEIAKLMANPPTSPEEIAKLLGRPLPSSPDTPANPADSAATTEPGEDATLPVLPDLSGDSAATTPPADPGAAATTPTDGVSGAPLPPPYLAPGADAARYPISTVAQLDAADVPLAPLRIAALAAALLALLLLTSAALLRALGVRTPAAGPVVVAPGGPVVRLGDRLRNATDDLRDFLRRSR
ncbi:MAG: hypothetical protein QM679_00345 [Patulibacter sp.]